LLQCAISGGITRRNSAIAADCHNISDNGRGLENAGKDAMQFSANQRRISSKA